MSYVYNEFERSRAAKRQPRDSRGRFVDEPISMRADSLRSWEALERIEAQQLRVMDARAARPIRIREVD